MIKIYTPKAWHSLFCKYPSLIINDDGYIYSEEYLYKCHVYPIGKINFSSGEVYGEDYNKWLASPIGYVIQNGAVTEIYGEDYRRKLIRYPIGYIKDNQYYTYEEYHKLLRTPSMYLEST